MAEYDEKQYDEKTYGDAWADIYDDALLGWSGPERIVDFLHKLHGHGRALDLGVGTGRVAIPLAARGVPVVGVDTSAAMLDRVRGKLAGEPVELVEADFGGYAPGEKFSLIYCVGQSFLQLQTPQAQRDCLATVRQNLAGDGRFVLECLTPDIRRFRVNQDYLTNKITVDRMLFTASLHDPLHQRIRSTMIEMGADGVQYRPNFIRYVWPSELLLMAELEGLALQARTGNYTGSPFTGKPGAYVAVFRPAA
jgi:SAM-dependent methyltransferase